MVKQFLIESEIGSTPGSVLIQPRRRLRIVPVEQLDSAALLRAHGLQVTAQRLAVLRAVADLPHCTADDVDRAARAEIGAISRQAVYDTLSALTGKGLLRRIEPAGSPGRYETRTGDNHHHLVCRTCERMVDVDCAVGSAPCLTAASDAGYEVDEAEVVYWGRCPECAAAAEPSMLGAEASAGSNQPSKRQGKTGRDQRV